jgi:pectate lyase
VPAFPGAEGSGAVSVGGRGGQVIEVTNLNDSGTGSLRAALQAPGPRIIVFRVGGTIEIETALDVSEPYLTIAGQTAPGDGICLRLSPKDAANDSVNRADMLMIATHDVVIRYLRLRLGPHPKGRHGRCLGIYPWRDYVPYNVIVDHCSISWGTDENFTVWTPTGSAGVPHDLTVQRSIISEGLYGHACGFISGGDDCEDMTDIDVHHNLFAHNSNRMPLLKNENGRVVNNIVYDWEWYGSGFEGGVTADIVGNYYKIGPSDTGEYEIEWQTHWSSCPDTGPPGNPSVYIAGNKGPHNSDPQADNWPMIHACPDWDNCGAMLTAYRRTTPQRTPTYPITVDPVLDLDSVLLNDVGCSRRLDASGKWVTMRDAVDSRIVTEYQTGTGMIPKTPSDVGGYPTYNDGTPYPDSDSDGMSDTWENTKFGSLSRNGTGDLDGDGYTDLEEFLNGTDPGG